jgi:hypothetical protein
LEGVGIFFLWRGFIYSKGAGEPQSITPEGRGIFCFIGRGFHYRPSSAALQDMFLVAKKIQSWSVG